MDTQPFSVHSTILLIDDDNALRTMVSRALREKFNVHEAADAFKAMAFLESNGAPDAIVCDVMMPGQNGFDFIRKVRADDRFKTVPVVFLTARTGAMDMVEGINAGARSYLTKPFKMAELTERLAKIVKTKPR